MTSALVLIKDGDKIRANLILSPGEEFTFTGSKKNEKFADKDIRVVLNGLINTVLGSSCKDLIVGGTYGTFTVVSAVSIGGSTVCCTTPPPDVTAPTFSNTPSSITIPATTQCNATLSWIEPTASDNCQLSSVTSTHKPADSFPIGTTRVVYTATDAAGLTTTASFTITVSDISPPKFIGGQSEVISVIASTGCSANVSWTEPKVTDECNFTLSRSHMPGDSFPLGTTSVKYTAIDASGNKAMHTFTIIVSKSKPPVFIDGPTADIVVGSDESCTAKVFWTEPQMANECGSTLIQSHKPGDTFNLGKTKVEYTATDASSNTSRFHFNIIVEDKRSLSFTNCPSDIVVTSEERSATKISWAVLSYTNLCEEIILETNHESGSYFRPGHTSVEYVASTSSGKKAYCNFDVTILVKEKNLEIAKIITPDGDGLNDHWTIANIENYPQNKVVIVDRWGGKIFEASGYNNESVVWNGTNRSGIMVPTGTYFYTIIASNGDNRIHERGAIELVN
jgi:gliding motility-associated-like protein